MRQQQAPLNWMIAMLAVIVISNLTACANGNPTGRSTNEIQYQPGQPCSPSDWNAVVSCPGDRTPTTCDRIVQYCDPANGNAATNCARFVDPTCATSGTLNVLPPVGTPGDGGMDGGTGGCTDGATRLCTTPVTLLPGVSTCMGGMYQGCTSTAMLVTYDGGLGSVPCGNDSRLGTSCTVGQGVCASTGTFVCVSNIVMCNAPPTASPTTEVCNNLDDDCDGMTDEQVTQTCYMNAMGVPFAPATTAGVGLCRYGTQTCAMGTFGACVGAVGPTTEVPGDMLDQDCNGGDDSMGPCGGDARIGQMCSVGRGACVRNGAFACGGNAFSCSAPAGTASSEICNNIDDDCDGVVDGTGGQPLIRTCYTGPAGTAGVGACRAGNQICTTGAWAMACAGQVVPVAEIPGNGIDEDCNGADLPIVNCGNDPNLGMSCNVGRGVCQRPGTWVCLMNGTMGCSATPGIPSPEVCNNMDDDCDGVIDGTGTAMVTQSCYAGPPGTAMVGVCRAGRQVCTMGTFGMCMGQILPSTEIADDGIDQDCSGGDYMGTTCGRDARIGTPCTSGRGTCLRNGIFACTAMQLSCNAMPGTPVVETCDNLDNDCDGMIDNNLSLGCYSGPPGTAAVGRCRSGMRTCTAGVLGTTCIGEILPSTEVCGNSIDDNCNNQVDENCAAMDGGMSDAMTSDATADAAPSDVVVTDASDAAVSDGGAVIVPSNVRYFVLGTSASCDTPPAFVMPSTPGFTWHRVCWQSPTGTGTIATEMSQHCDWTDTVQLPEYLPSQAVPAGQALHVLISIRTNFPTGQACFNARLNGSSTQFVRGLAGGSAVAVGTLRDFRLTGGVSTELTLQNIANGLCNGVNGHPVNTECPPYPDMSCSLRTPFPCTP